MLSSFINSGKHKRDANSLASSDNSNTNTQSALAKKYTLNIVRVNDAAIWVETRKSLIRVSFDKPRAVPCSAVAPNTAVHEPPVSKLVLPVTHVQVWCGARQSLGILV